MLGLAQKFERFRIFVIGIFGDVRGGGNQTATHGSLIDDFGVGLGVRGGRYEAS